MSTTVLTAHESSWKVRGQDVFFDALSCVPDVGDVGHIDCTFHWWVFRDGSPTPIREEFKGRLFSHFGEPGDEVVLRFWDQAGNYGGEDRYVYGASDVAAFSYYCDATLGNDANPGTEAQPFQTLAAMVTAARAALTADNACVLYLKRGETFTTTTAMVAGGSTRRQFQFEAYGSGARPQVNSTTPSLTLFTNGDAESYRSNEINWTGSVTAAGENGFFSNQGKTTPGTGAAHDVVIRNATITSFTRVGGSSDEPGSANRTSGYYDFVRFEDVTCVNSGNYHFYGLQQRRYLTFRNVTYGNSQAWAGIGERWRLQECGPIVVDDLTPTNTDNAVVRFQGGDQDTDTPDMNLAFGPMTARRIVIPPASNSKGVALQTDMPGTYMGVFEMVEFHDCNLAKGTFALEPYTGTANVWLENLIVTNLQNQASAAIFLRYYAGTRGRIKRVQFKNHSCWSPDGGGRFIDCQWPASRVDDDAFVIKNNAWWLPAGSPQSRQFIRFTAMTLTEAASKIAECEGNHVGKSDTASVDWVNTTSGGTTITTWRSSYGFDTIGSLTRVAGDPLLWTAYPNTADGSGCDPRISSTSSPQHNGGYETPSYDVDSDGYLYSTTARTAGAYQFFEVGDPTPEPETPTPTGVSSTIIRTGLRLGLRLGL